MGLCIYVEAVYLLGIFHHNYCGLLFDYKSIWTIFASV